MERVLCRGQEGDTLMQSNSFPISFLGRLTVQAEVQFFSLQCHSQFGTFQVLGTAENHQKAFFY